MTRKTKRTTEYYSVITGDIIGSSTVKGKRKQLLTVMKNTFKEITIEFSDAVEKPFEIYRGDSFQTVVKQPGKALLIGILIRAKLKSFALAKTKTKYSGNKLDARIAIGIGEIGFNADKAIESDGEAFNISGKLLDEIKKSKQNLKIQTPWHDMNGELEVESYFADTIINKWTIEQAEAVYLKLLKNKTQQMIAKKLKISQPAVRKRIIGANLKCIELFVKRFENILNLKL